MKSKTSVMFLLLGIHCIDATYKGNLSKMLSIRKHRFYFTEKLNIKFADYVTFFSFQFTIFLHQMFIKRNG